MVWIQRSPQQMKKFLAVQSSQTSYAAELLFDVITEFPNLNGSLFTETGRVLNHVADNKTRWNSTYLMLTRALELKVYIDFFVGHTLELKNDRLSKRDWSILTAIYQLLEPFWEYTMELEGHAKADLRSAIGEVIHALEDQKDHLEIAKAALTTDTDSTVQYLITCIN